MPEALIDRALLEKLERLALRWRHSHHGPLGGHNRSRLAGYGHEFLDHRNFYPGDDLRAVNWRAYLRFERFLLKTFELEPRIPIRLLLDVSGSMGMGDKFNYARKLALAIVYVALVNLDTVTILPFAEKLLRPVEARGGRQRIHESERPLRQLKADGRTDFAVVARSMLKAYRRPGLIIVISDFLGDEDPLRPLQMLADEGHELLLVQVWAWEDRNPEFDGPMELIDSETGALRRVTGDRASKREYQERITRHSADLKRMALRKEGRCIDISTRTPIEEALFGPMRGMLES